MSKIDQYKNCLLKTTEWLKLSIDPETGGSRAYYSLVSGWSAPYPETTGYIIPTMINSGKFFNNEEYIDIAHKMGEWLLKIQLDNGAWQGGLYKGKVNNEPSVFNTGQILLGLASLYELTGDKKWADSAMRGAKWLQSGINDKGTWDFNDYRSKITPTYYSRVAWPMLEIWKITEDNNIKDAAERVLDYVLSNRQKNGTFKNWGFENNKPAFSHTIAYTLRGLIESGLILDNWEKYASPTEKALEKLLRKAELNNGRLSGTYDTDWKPVNYYSCLTGNLQTAICLMILEERSEDLRIVNAATKLIDWVANKMSRIPIKTIKNAVPGSWPVYGRYMFLRFPNWASKYFCDSTLRLIKRLEKEYH